MNWMPDQTSSSANTIDGETVGLVLAGGGAYGAYEVGVMKALFHGEASACGGSPLDAELFAGTSVGAFNAAAMVAYAETGLAQAVTTVEKIWRDTIAEAPSKCGNGFYRLRGVPNPHLLQNPLGLLTDALDDGLHFLRETLMSGRRFLDSSEPLSRRTLELLDFTSLFDTRPFAHSVATSIPLEAIERSSKILKIIAVNFDLGEVQVFENREIATTVGHDAILASAAIPVFFKPVEIGGHLFVDGGSLMNTPILPAVGGASTLHVIYMDPDVAKIPVETLQSTIGVLDRLLVTNWAFAMNREIEIISEINRSHALLNERHTLPPNDSPRFSELIKAAEAVSAFLGGKHLARTTIHRYHPTDDLGGMTGFLDVRADRIDALIERGYRDAIAHDCEKSGCVFPVSTD